MASPYPQESAYPLAPLTAKWGWIVALGVVYLIAGIVALGSVVAATAASVFVVGIMMVIAGVAEVINAFSSAPGADFSSGSFSAYSTSSPASSPSQIRSWPRCGLTLFLGAALVASGILRIYLGFNMQHESP